MKRIVTLFFIFLFTVSLAKSQVLDTSRHSSSDLYKMYMKKRNTNNTAGWVLLGSGLIIAGASYLAYVNNGFNGVWEQAGLFTVSSITALASIPLFVFARINKRKAKLALKGETITSKLLLNSYRETHFAALSLKIAL